MIRKLSFLLVLLGLTAWPALAQETLVFTPPPSGLGPFTSIQLQQRTFFINQTGATGGATFSITAGGATIVSSTHGYVTVQAPSAGGSCTPTGTTGSWGIAASVSYTIQAVSVNVGGPTATISIPVCQTVPYAQNYPNQRMGVYAGQWVCVVATVIGQVDKSGTWGITQASGGNMSFIYSAGRDACVSATVAGRYTLTFTSTTGSLTSTTIIDLPDATPLPYNLTQINVNQPAGSKGAEPVHCIPDSNLTGTVYNVGPSQAYTSFLALPHNTTGFLLNPGDMVIFHNENGGSSPTLLANMAVIQTQGTQAQPIVVCGQANSSGYMPIWSGVNATTNLNPNQYYTGYALLSVFYNVSTTYTAPYLSPENIDVMGIDFEDVNGNENYTIGGNAPWGSNPNSTNTGCLNGPTDFSSPFRFQNGSNVSFIGNISNNTGLGIFTEAKPIQGAMGYSELIEGNTFTNYSIVPMGNIGNATHGLYSQVFGALIQFNRTGPASSTANGDTFKDRGVGSIVRYNWFNGNDQTLRWVSADDQEDASYTNTFQYFATSDVGGSLDDDAPIWYVAAWDEEWQDDSFYGNTGQALSPQGEEGIFHYFGDHGSYSTSRYGKAHTYNNTFYEVPPGNGIWVYDISDATSTTLAMAWPEIDDQNSIWWSGEYYLYERERYSILNVVNVVTPSTCCTNEQILGNGPLTPANAGWAGTSAYPISSYSISTDVGTFNDSTYGFNLYPGAPLLLSGFVTSTFLNGQTVTNTCGYCASDFTGTVASHADVPTTTEAGVAGLYDPNLYADYNILATHISGWGTSGSPVPDSVSTIPFNTTTFATVSAAGTALTGVDALLPVYLQFRPDQGYPTLRSTAVTSSAGGKAGAVDSAGVVLASIAVTPNPASITGTGTAQLAATGTYSDASTHDLTASATWSNGSSPYFSITNALWQNLQYLGSGGWTNQGGTSCCGGSNTGSPGISYGNTNPALSGQSIEMTSTGNGFNTQGFTNGSCANFPGATCSGVTDLVVDGDVYIPSTSSTPQALEGFDVAFYTGTYLLQPSIQCDSASGNWRIWNGAGSAWVSSGFSCGSFLTNTNTWQHVHVHYTINQGLDTMTYDDLTVNGTPVFTGLGTTYTGISYSATATAKVQVQIDNVASGSPVTTVYYDNINLTSSPATPGLAIGISPGSGTASATFGGLTGTATVNDSSSGPSYNRIRQGSFVMR